MTKVLSRFLVFLLAALVVVTVALTLFYFLRSDEVFSFSEGKDDNLVRYVNTGETLDVTVYRTNASADTYSLISSDETILKFKEKVSENVFRFETVANKGGKAEVQLQTSNTKYSGLSLTVRVGNGTETYPFFVRNYTDLANVGKTEKFTLDSCYIQVADIDMSVAKESWTPIGDLESETFFSGAYNGNGHSINNFTMKKEGKSSIDASNYDLQDLLSESAGLFYALDEGGLISRINFNKVTISGDYVAVAPVVVVNCGTVQFINVKDLSITNTNSKSDVAGIVAVSIGFDSVGSQTFTKESYTAQVMYCGVIGSIVTNGSDVGGIVSTNGCNSLVMNNYARISIETTSKEANVGGIVGCNSGIANDASGKASSGEFAKASVVNNYSIVQFKLQSNASYGAIIGHNTNVDKSVKVVLNPENDTEKTYNRIYGNYFLADSSGSLKGIGNTTVSDSDYIAMGLTSAQMKKVVSAADLEKLNTEGATIDKTLAYVTYSGDGVYISWNFEKTWEMKSGQNNGYPFINSKATAQDEIVFNGKSVSPTPPTPPTPPGPEPEPETMTQEELRALFDKDFADDQTYNGSYVISKDVIMTTAWVPVGTAEHPFNGQFVMTNGAKIRNLFIEDCEGVEYYGFFGYVGSKAQINGVSIEGVKIVIDEANGKNVSVGALAGYCEAKSLNGITYSIYSTLYNKTYITASSDEGFDKIYVSNKNDVYVGGVLGRLGSQKKAYDLHASINIKVADCKGDIRVGGVVGFNNGYVESCSYDGVINKAGAYTYTIDARDVTKANLNIGGITGKNTYIISYSSFAGKLLANSDDVIYTGGIAGFSEGAIEKCAVKQAQINGGYYVGGIVGGITVNELLVTSGKASDYAVVSESYSSGSVTGKRVGGLIATLNNGTIINCYTTANLKGEVMAGFVTDLPYGSDANCGKVKYCYSGATFERSAGQAYWESASVVRQTTGIWAGNRKLAGYIENCIYNTHGIEDDSIKRQYSYYILNKGYDCDDGRNSDENCKKVSTFTSRGSGFDTKIWVLTNFTYPVLMNVA